MRSGLFVCGFFAAAWAILGMIIHGLPIYFTAIPAALSLALFAASSNVSAPQGSGGPHVAKLVFLWSLIELIAILVSAHVFQHLHRVDLAFLSAVIIVGAHFLPLARGIPLRLYYGTGAGMILVGFERTLAAKA